MKMLSKKTTKIIVDLLMLIAVVLSLVRWNGEPTFHLFVGTACTVLFVVHCCLNRKTFAAYGKGIKKLNLATKQRYAVDWLLLVVWGIAIISSVPALLVYLDIMQADFPFGRIHGIFSRIGVVLIAVHIFQHGKQIISYFKKK
jgi:hypothetical protein